MSAVDLRRLLMRSALFGCILMGAIVGSSAFLRLSGAGHGCADWPTCYGQIRQSGPHTAGLHPPEPTLGVRLARAAHRISAMLAGILVLLTLAVSTQRGARSTHNLACGAALLVLTLFLAVLGRFTTGSLSPAVALANLAGGYGMLLLFWSIFRANRVRAQHASEASRWPQALALLALLLASAQALLGGLVSAKFGALSCVDLASCWRLSSALGLVTTALDPFPLLTLDATGRVVPTEDAAAVNALHRAGVFVLIPTVLVLSAALALVSRRRLCSALLALIVVAQSAAGWSLAGQQFSLPLALLHNALGAILLMCIVTAVHPDGSRLPEAPGTT